MKKRRAIKLVKLKLIFYTEANKGSDFPAEDVALPLFAVCYCDFSVLCNLEIYGSDAFDNRITDARFLLPSCVQDMSPIKQGRPS